MNNLTLLLDAVKGGEKMYHVGGSIVGFGRLKTVPPGVFHGADIQPMEGAMDVSRGHIFSGAPGLPGGGNERSGGFPGVRRASGHGAQDAGECDAAGLHAAAAASQAEPFDKLRRSPSPA